MVRRLPTGRLWPGLTCGSGGDHAGVLAPDGESLVTWLAVDLSSEAVAARPADVVERQLGVLGRVDPAVRPSLALDLAADRRLEIDAFNGAVVRLAREHGVPAPLNFALYAALKPYADGPPAQA